MILSERKGKKKFNHPEYILLCTPPKTHTQTMYPKHSTAHSNVQNSISKMLLPFEITQIMLRRENSNNARDGKMNILKPMVSYEFGYCRSLSFTTLNTHS